VIAGVLVLHALVELHLAEIDRPDPSGGDQPGEGRAEAGAVEDREIDAEQNSAPDLATRSSWSSASGPTWPWVKVPDETSPS
jgi:hypothetical protein